MSSESSEPGEKKRRGARAVPFRRGLSRNNKSAGCLLLLAFLIGGGGTAWFLMKEAAYNLVGDDRPELAAGDGAPSGMGVAGGAFFSADDGEAEAALGPDERARLSASALLARSSPASRTRDGKPGPGGNPDGAVPAGGTAGGRAYTANGGDASRGSASRLTTTGKKKGGPAELSDFASASGKTVGLRSSSPGEYGSVSGKKAKSSVLDSLKGAFKTNLIGARLASQDAARTWMARTFDANRGSRHSLEYSEKMKVHLDRVDPDSIPGFLRSQSLDATSAKSLGVSKVDMPSFDRKGTQDALAADRDYQQKKMTQEIISAMFKPMGPFDEAERDTAETSAASTLLSSQLGAESMGTFGLESWDEPVDLPAEKPAPAVNSGGESGAGWSAPKPKPSVYQLPPEDQQTLETDAAQELATTPSVDYGGECGCTPQAPCCCLPPGYLDPKNEVGVGNAILAGADFSGFSGASGVSGSVSAGVSASGSVGGGGGSW